MPSKSELPSSPLPHTSAPPSWDTIAAAILLTNNRLLPWWIRHDEAEWIQQWMGAAMSVAQTAAPATASCSCAIPLQGYSVCIRPCLHCLLSVRQNAQPILTRFTVPSDNHKYAATALHKLQAPIRTASLS